jgi:predicted RNA binding protein YcfA (HicA-like mRNA interferase family)
MTKLPRLNRREVIKAPSNGGFRVIRVRGSHHLLRHADGRTTTVPVQGGEIIGPGLLTRILRDCEITGDEFTALNEA